MDLGEIGGASGEAPETQLLRPSRGIKSMQMATSQREGVKTVAITEKERRETW